MRGLVSPGRSLNTRFKRAYRHSELLKLQRWLKGKTLHWSLYLVFSCLVLGGLLNIHYYRYCHFYAVRVDGVEVGLTRNSEKVEQIVEDLTGKCNAFYRMDLFPEQEIALSREYRPDGVDRVQGIREALMQRLTFLTDAVMVTVDGFPVAAVSTAEKIGQIVKKVGLVFISEGKGVELEEIELQESISGRQCIVSPEQIYSPDEIVLMLTRPETEQGLLVAASREAIGSRFGRNKQAREATGPVVPTVHVKTVEKATVEEQVSFATEYSYTDKMYVGESRVVSPGKHGLKEVVYRITRENGAERSREILSTRIIAEPEPRMVECGTLRRFAWPVAGGGRITQRFHAGHRGIDVAAAPNTPILAAESGVVVQSAWGPSQGYYIVIRHGAYFTTYLHNSTNLVSTGQTVTRGQTIARLGSTGNSTGPHLHFEIRRRTGYYWGGWNTHPAINPLQFF